jgi:hypothetical protein
MKQGSRVRSATHTVGTNTLKSGRLWDLTLIEPDFEARDLYKPPHSRNGGVCIEK